MTTLAKIEANKRNGDLSTGPRTFEGKAIVARNATKHGIFAAVAVIPGECPDQWEAHRAGVVDSLAPVGLLEINLAERTALLLWRLQRLARYEVEIVAADFVEAVVVPPLPPPENKDSFFGSPKQMTRDEQLSDIRRELRAARDSLAEVTPGRDFFRSSPELGSDAIVPLEVVASILEFAIGRAQTDNIRRTEAPRFDSKPFLKKLRVNETDPEKVTWTRGLLDRSLRFYSDYSQETAEQFIETVRDDLEESAEASARKVRRLEAEQAAVVWLLDGKPRKHSAELLPGNGRDERIAKYERHLHTLLTSTLHELERLQARREGQSVPPPAVADVNVMIDSGAA